MPVRSVRLVDPVTIDELVNVRRSKWTVTVVLHLRGQTLRFSELRREITSLSQKTLTSTLRDLERDGFVSRTSFATIPPRVDYALTDLGNEVLLVFEALEDFMAENWSEVLASRRSFDAVHPHEHATPVVTLTRASR